MTSPYTQCIVLNNMKYNFINKFKIKTPFLIIGNIYENICLQKWLTGHYGSHIEIIRLTGCPTMFNQQTANWVYLFIFNEVTPILKKRRYNLRGFSHVNDAVPLSNLIKGPLMVDVTPLKKITKWPHKRLITGALVDMSKANAASLEMKGAKEQICAC